MGVWTPTVFGGSLGNVNGWQNFNADGIFKYSVLGKFVIVHCYQWYGYNSTSNVMGVLPIAYRPSFLVSCAAANIKTDNTTSSGIVTITSNGDISYNRSQADNYCVSFFCMFILS